MKKTVTRAFLVALLLALLAAGQSACGGSSYDPPSAPSSSPGQLTPTPY